LFCGASTAQEYNEDGEQLHRSKIDALDHRMKEGEVSPCLSIGMHKIKGKSSLLTSLYQIGLAGKSKTFCGNANVVL